MGEGSAPRGATSLVGKSRQRGVARIQVALGASAQTSAGPGAKLLRVAVAASFGMRGCCRLRASQTGNSNLLGLRRVKRSRGRLSPSPLTPGNVLPPHTSPCATIPAAPGAQLCQEMSGGGVVSAQGASLRLFLGPAVLPSRPSSFSRRGGKAHGDDNCGRQLGCSPCVRSSARTQPSTGDSGACSESPVPPRNEALNPTGSREEEGDGSQHKMQPPNKAEVHWGTPAAPHPQPITLGGG